MTSPQKRENWAFDIKVSFLVKNWTMLPRIAEDRGAGLQLDAKSKNHQFVSMKDWFRPSLKHTNLYTKIENTKGESRSRMAAYNTAKESHYLHPNNMIKKHQ